MRCWASAAICCGPKFGLLVRDVMNFNAQAQETVERHPDLSLEA